MYFDSIMKSVVLKLCEVVHLGLLSTPVALTQNVEVCIVFYFYSYVLPYVSFWYQWSLRTNACMHTHTDTHNLSLQEMFENGGEIFNTHKFHPLYMSHAMSRSWKLVLVLYSSGNIRESTGFQVVSVVFVNTKMPPFCPVFDCLIVIMGVKN